MIVEGTVSDVFTSGWGVFVGAAWTGSPDETTGIRGRDVAIAEGVCCGVDVTGIDADTSWASESSVSPCDKVGNGWAGNTNVVS